MPDSTKMKIVGESDAESVDIKTPKNIRLTRKHALIILGCFAFIYIGTILITYFGKSCPKTYSYPKQEEIIDNCKNFLCQNRSILEGWEKRCPVKTSPVPITTPVVKKNFRLPTEIKPLFYDLQIKAFVGPSEELGDKAFTFEGLIKMHLKCYQPTDKIVFHQKDLNLTLVELTSNEDQGIDIVNKNFEFDYEKDFVFAYLNRPCKQDVTYILSVKFTGIILDKLYGFYRSSYTDKTGKKFYLATTKFEPTYARRAFPCFDEPAMKAEFQITIIRQKHLASYSNNPLDRTEPDSQDSDWEIDYFNRTVKMSTYLVAYVIADFPSKSNETEKGITVEVSARREAIDNGDGDFGLSEAGKIIDFFSDYFNVSYPLPKSTQIAIPDFNSGAMENWGLVTYRESSLLYNPERDTVSNKKRVSNVVSHELAHQWFGNLVTMLWWNDLWLNEGFASWVEYLGYNHTHPEWRDLDYFFVQKLGPFVQDSLESSHPISVEVNDPNEITSLFDGISYSKGASIIRMMNAFLTEYTFKRGVSNYLNKYALSNAEQDNLWEELTLQAHQDGTLSQSLSVKDIMDTWTLKKGYPVVQIKRDGNKMKLTQSWFLLNPSNKMKNRPEFKTYKWYVPFTYTNKQELNFDFETKPIWLTPDTDECEDSWIIGNLKHSGFYRVNYDQDNWNLLIKQLNDDHLKIDPIHRAQLIDDSFNLGRAQVIDQLVFLDITKYLTSEIDALPFTAAFYGLDYISDMLSGDFFVFESFKKFYMGLLDSNYNRLGWNLNLNDVNEINLQLNTIQIMCSFGNQDCINTCRDFYNDWINNDKAIPSNFKSIVLSTVIKYGNKDDWFKMFELAKKTSDNAEKLRLLRALTNTQDYNLLKFILYQSANESIVRRQDETTIVVDVSNNPIGRKMAFDYLDEKWDDFIRKFGDISFTLPNLVSKVLGKLNTKFDARNIELFKVNHPNLGIASNVFKESTETVNSNIVWMDKYFDSISQWLTALNK